MKIIRDIKLGLYNFQWRVILEDNLYQLQRFSKEYNTWFSVKSSLDENQIIKMYDQLEQ
jgi:hypothetical protein